MLKLKADRDGKTWSIYSIRKDPYAWLRWIQFSPGWRGIRLSFGLASYFDCRPMISFCLGWGSFYIHLPFKTKYDECDPPEYGLYYFENALWIQLGRKVKKIPMPWEMEWVRTSALRKDGTWEHERKGDRKSFYEEKWKGVLWIERYPYTYVLKSGEAQQRTATLKVEEREWRPLWFMWTRLFASKRRTISIDFDDEVGERSGSWKGGVMGCSHEMKDGELPEMTLRRMEAERKFN